MMKERPKFDDMSPKTDASASEVEDEKNAKSPRKGKAQEREEESDASDWGDKTGDVREKRGDTTGSNAKTAEQTQESRTIADPGIEPRFHALSTDDIDDDDEEGNYQIVKKSIYKPHRKGFLSRLAGGSPVASTKQKYALSDITGIITGEETEAATFSSKAREEEEVENADLTIEEGEDIESRASSPRGRSKNIQLIELKRANNLALALASFKIHDHYEQIVNDIVTMDERVVNPALLGFQGMQERIDMFLYKMEFGRTRSALLSRVLVVKRACRDLVENYSFIEALEQFFKQQNITSFTAFEDNKSMFRSGYLSEADEKLRSFRGDLEKAMGVELVELQLQLNRLVAGFRPIQSFVNRSPSSRSAQSEERDGKARDILQRFLADTRTQLAEIESEYEAMELWGDKLLAAFGESKATCQISAILQAVVELL
ncbi:hypothetical protein JG687_00000329 [Phytophthora cactorum]|uniref:Uncharacterized protein n=1 Tax=Phytophthora cactorum TaxID=29920 RepID=A0A8T1V3W1_9STRA|nr:hypothetical protein JG687_00000329 [Phytophthora cactorum]